MQRTDSAKNARRDKITALIALAILAVLASYHVADVRGAFADLDAWWIYFKPLYPGDDYALVTQYAERQDDWHDRYRAISLGMAIRRAAPGVETVYQPLEMWELWGESEDAPVSWEHPGIKDDYFSQAIARAERVSAEYDPVLPASTITAWENEGTLENVAWNVTYVSGAEDDTAVFLHCDETRTTIYVVPASLSPAQWGEAP